jgi:hypothetical protein
MSAGSLEPRHTTISSFSRSGLSLFSPHRAHSNNAIRSINAAFPCGLNAQASEGAFVLYIALFDRVDFIELGIFRYGILDLELETCRVHLYDSFHL